MRDEHARSGLTHAGRRLVSGLVTGLITGLMAVGMTGCLERTIHITSDPPGALVWVNDIEVGYTPCETEFTYFGTYDVRVRLDGHEPLNTKAVAEQPMYEYPPFDLVATVAPADIETNIRWHFTLEPAKELAQSPELFQAELLERATQTRGMIR
ncbi:MAG: PEGA domain-containing protein [Planctomycetota bacterium]|nr:PEGA domain-containing protein [Planctomycetota bacterium]